MIEKTSLPAGQSRSYNVSDSKSASVKAPSASQRVSVETQTAEVSKKQTARSISSIISSSGLPSDKLSTSIVSFARFFSLPLKPNVLAVIRQQAFSSTQQTATPQSAGNATLTGTALNQSAATSSAFETSEAMKMREALSLAAAAAESKGVELNQKGLEQYAEAINPDLNNQHEKEDRKEKKQNKNKNEQEDKTEINAAVLEKTVNECTPQLIEILNRIPGKNGQRWIVLPFNFSKDGNDFDVSMRVLLENENRAVRMAVQITESREQLTGRNEKRKWLFVFDNNFIQQKEELSSCRFSKLILFLEDELPSKEQEKYKKEISALLEIPYEQIKIKKSLENFPFEGACEDQLIIDEMV